VTVKTFDSLIFDLDGTLWDTCQGCAQTWNLVLQEKNIPYRTITEADMSLIMGKTHNQIRAMFFSDLEIPFADELMHEILQRENQIIAQSDGWQLYSGVREGLERLSQDYPLFIVSNCQEGYIECFDHCTNLVTQYIKDVEYHGRTGRPKGENIRELKARNGLNNALYIGDTQGDSNAAAIADCDFAFASYGFGQVDNPKWTLEHFSELTLSIINK